jgi:mono/diheme cytochrome c family protein
MLDESTSIMHLHNGTSQYPLAAPRHAHYIKRLRSAALCLCALVSITSAASAQDQSATQADLIAKGRYLATAADCAACHTAPHSGQPFAGGYAIESPLGKIFSTNITPSKADGIGSYSEEDFARAVRDGIAKDGSHLYPAMPYTAYAKLSDEDMSALYAYFMQEVKPVDHAPEKTELPFPFSIRASMSVWNLLFLSKDRFQPDASKSAEWNRGAYLAEALEHCSTCHTPRNTFMAENDSKALSGGALGAWYAPNITSDPVNGIGGWSQDEIVQYLKTGRAAGKAQAAGPMAEAVENGLQHLNDTDLNALAVYLKETKPISGSEAKPRYEFGQPSVTEAALRGLPGQQPNENGFHIFSGTCAACHQPDGVGNKHYPSLFHNTATGADSPANLVATVLFGLSRTVGDETIFMPGFGPNAPFTDRLSDQDIADVSNYVLTQYGNPAAKVTAADVAELRQGGPEPLIVKLAPFAAPAAGIGGLIVILAIVWMVRRRQRPATA